MDKNTLALILGVLSFIGVLLNWYREWRRSKSQEKPDVADAAESLSNAAAELLPRYREEVVALRNELAESRVVMQKENSRLQLALDREILERRQINFDNAEKLDSMSKRITELEKENEELKRANHTYQIEVSALREKVIKLGGTIGGGNGGSH